MLKLRPRHPASHWQSTRRLTSGLLLIWFVLTFSVIFFARELSNISLFGWPLSFYMAAQGLALIYLLIVAVYTWQMKKADQRQPDREQQ
ncbi:putative solute:sodium symporter small subunit [Collimonas sp. OK607]|uniref:DUF4212 domain-containing protein n=1 Tax=Collimonas sp. OK607 TaxID=1798194 RepID=UPI0008EC4744|nr:DUF4212 domain-containing protein [Collimonas sp. OK607]SFB30655.1 putative solute:sodium symporter small subunit [Collimonas sp. OK607]